MIAALKRQTKVIWSLEGNGLNDFDLRKLTEKDVGALRIVYSPDYVKEVLDFLHKLKALRNDRILNIPIMIDVTERAQAKVVFPEKALEVEYGSTITVGIHPGCDVIIKTDSWDQLFKLDELAYVGYGSTILRVTERNEQDIKAKVIHSGIVQPGAEIQVPASRKSFSILDLSNIDIESFKDLDVDYVILPGVTAREVALAKKKITYNGKLPWVVVKIDAKNIYDQLDEILEEADGVMVCRRELALTTNPATIPMLGKDIIQRSFAKAKLIIMASEMLASMRFNPTPTRAEVSDIANAVIDGSDAVVLSEEIELGPYKDRAYAVCNSIIEDLEQESVIAINWQRSEVEIENELDAVAYHAYRTADRLKAKAIVCITKSGNTALRLASFRIPIPIIAVTFSEDVKRKLSLVRGVSSVILDIDPNLDEVLPAVNDKLKRDSWLSQGDRIVFVTVTLSSVGREASNLFTVQRLE